MALILEFPGFPQNQEMFFKWLESLDATATFKPMRTNECIIAQFLLARVLTDAERSEEEGRTKILTRFPSSSQLSSQREEAPLYEVRVQGYALILHPTEPGCEQLQFDFDGTWVQLVSDEMTALGIPPSRNETECTFQYFLTALMKAHLERCLTRRDSREISN